MDDIKDKLGEEIKEILKKEEYKNLRVLVFDENTKLIDIFNKK